MAQIIKLPRTPVRRVSTVPNRPLRTMNTSIANRRYGVPANDNCGVVVLRELHPNRHRPNPLAACIRVANRWPIGS